MSTITNDLNRKTINFDTPIKRGQTTIDSVEIRRPTAGELRGTSLFALARMDTDSIVTVLPRVTEPPLIEHEILKMDPADLFQCGIVIANFMMPKSMQGDLDEVSA